MCQKIDHLVEASAYDCDGLLAPYSMWPSHKSAELKGWLDDRKKEAEKRLEKPATTNA